MTYQPTNQQPEQPAAAPYTPEAPTQVYPTEQLPPADQPPVYQQATPAYSYETAPAQYQSAPATTLPTTLAQTNTYALVSILTVFLMPILGIIFGHLGLNQIKRNGDAGRGLALTGMIFGYAYFAFILIFIIFYISMIGLIFASMGAALGEMGSYDGFGESW